MATVWHSLLHSTTQPPQALNHVISRLFVRVDLHKSQVVKGSEYRTRLPICGARFIPSDVVLGILAINRPPCPRTNQVCFPRYPQAGNLNSLLMVVCQRLAL